MYDLCYDDSSFIFVARDPSRYLMSTFPAEDEEGWSGDMLKLVSGTGEV